MEALELFRKMQRQRVQPSEFTMVSLLGACAHLGALQHGEWVHDYVKKGHFELNVIVLTSIIDMHCKCGAIVKGIQGQSNTHNICGVPCMANQHSTSVTTSSIAHALYLHHDCTLPIVHRDISASNVLVNSEWEHCYICPTLNVYFAGKKKNTRNQMP
ncbi:Pentatricopeptide repeat-containing protein, chloroplastic [Glycine soja]